MTETLSGPMVAPKSGAMPKQVVVLLHGYGSDGRDLIGLAGYWRDILPEALFVSPNAPWPCDAFAAGFQWFPVDPDRPGFRLEGVAAARPVLLKFLEDLWAQTGLGPADTILAGFSQGAMMALNVGLTLDRAVLGIIGFSGALIVPPGWLEEAGPKPPVAIIHGDADTVVDPELGQQAVALLKAKGIEVAYHVDPGSGHTIAPAGLAFASGFIEGLLHAGKPVT
ncbi:MAG TPA: prolyl oligopeptidase family serine peptidase [Devosia sp.]|nr:prolyl oligopeptidase family serine peptidase [Devosia sp.]